LCCHHLAEPLAGTIHLTKEKIAEKSVSSPGRPGGSVGAWFVKDAEQFGLPVPDPTSAQTAGVLGTSRRELYILIASGLLGSRQMVRGSIRRYCDAARIAGKNLSRALKPLCATATSDAP
jgi:hypothetical protein